MHLTSGAIELIEEARKKGIKVVVIHMSRHQSLSQHYAETLQSWQKDLQKLLAPYPDVQFWISPTDWEVTDYCDYAHLNDSGRDKFMKWVTPRLRQLSEKAEAS